VQFRHAVATDAPALAALVHSAYRGDTSRQGWTSEADLLDGDRISAGDVAAIIAEPEALVLVGLDDDGDILACCELRHSRRGVGYFGMFAVRPGLTGRGTGRTVMAEAERLAVELWGVSSMEMSVIAQRTELTAWYERMGYRRTGETKPFPYGDARFGQPRREDLYFEVLSKPLGEQGQ
jgi:ribosomal protein S18 acetylase RimI-like enzyme